MPMPGSQEMKSINLAYFLYTYRWFFRIFFVLMIATGCIRAFQMKIKWFPLVALVFAITIIYIINFQMTADRMFKQPENLIFKSSNENRVEKSSLVICVEHNGVAKGYPVQFMAYHHQVQDTVGGVPLIITYCSVCRTGRVFEPKVKGYHETFRLVGMDHYNAMFEDAKTKSWWRQSTGEAIAGLLKGESLHESESTQITINKLFEMHPDAMVMQADEASRTEYDTLRKFELGLSKSKLTRTDSISWGKKSWIIGIQVGAASKAYDWINLKKMHIINDKIGEKPIILVLSDDEQSFAAFERPSGMENFTIRNDTLFTNGAKYDFSGHNLIIPSQQLKSVRAYQEFWHSWKVFHPDTQKEQ
jgi:hypothetical protein